MRVEEESLGFSSAQCALPRDPLALLVGKKEASKPVALVPTNNSSTGQQCEVAQGT